jgi:hypothetical protein
LDLTIKGITSIPFWIHLARLFGPDLGLGLAPMGLQFG